MCRRQAFTVDNVPVGEMTMRPFGAGSQAPLARIESSWCGVGIDLWGG